MHLNNDYFESVNNMEIPASRWYGVIEKRRSRRNYEEKLPKPNHLKKLQKVCNTFRPFESARTVLVKEPPDNVFSGIIGAYGVIKGAKAFMAFIGNTRDPAVEEKVGYTGEGIILEAEALSLNTCWIGGMFKRKLVDSMIELQEHERVYAITPVGYARKRINL